MEAAEDYNETKKISDFDKTKINVLTVTRMKLLRPPDHGIIKSIIWIMFPNTCHLLI